MLKIWDKYPALKTELAEVKKFMKNNIDSGEKYIDEPIIELIDSGGKMLRPALVLIGSRFGHHEDSDAYKMASIIELLHISTLIHDDIIDDSKSRRGNLSVQYKYGKNSAVFIGDYLFTKGFSLLAKNYTMDEMDHLSKAISKICLGEIRQNTLKLSHSLSVKKYLKMIAGKTAALFALSLYVGAKIAEVEESDMKLLGKIGYQMGMAFQIQDDILDFTGDPDLLGKDLINDIKEGYYSLPIIYAKKNGLAHVDLESLSPSEIINQVESSGGIEKARNVANKYIEKTYKLLDLLPENESKDILVDIINILVSRNY